MGCGGIQANKKLSWREGGIRAWAVAVLMGSWCREGVDGQGGKGEAVSVLPQGTELISLEGCLEMRL